MGYCSQGPFFLGSILQKEVISDLHELYIIVNVLNKKKYFYTIYYQEKPITKCMIKWMIE